ncbi:unnamed protein product [Caenorhabditis angaria]|uniref:Phospholipase A(2) n=1 Tax=Caenorhabditis angaria TaxID=860376 RepID=A0A9P1III1_9PELO|nr:unnamed protein product [Caenorhabditis angaria]
MIFLGILFPTLVLAERLNLTYWNCGSQTNPISITASETYSRLACAKPYYDFNLCCAIHDDCYNQKNGQQFCDTKFCDCLEDASRGNGLKCFVFEEAACYAVRNHGGKAYDLSNVGNSGGVIYKIKNNSKIAKEFAKLYENCVVQRLTFNTCAINFDNCMENTRNQKSCIHQLHTCLSETDLMRKIDGKCDKVVQNVREVLKKIENSV